MGKSYVGIVVPQEIKDFFAKVHFPLLGDIPFIGHVFFRQDVFAYFGYVLVAVTAIYFYRTRQGLNLKAVGESAASADASGINVTMYKYVHTCVGGALCGLGGAHVSGNDVRLGGKCGCGRGWIAVALVIFASWNPIKAL